MRLRAVLANRVEVVDFVVDGRDAVLQPRHAPPSVGWVAVLRLRLVTPDLLDVWVEFPDGTFVGSFEVLEPDEADALASLAVAVVDGAVEVRRGWFGGGAGSVAWQGHTWRTGLAARALSRRVQSPEPYRPTNPTLRLPGPGQPCPFCGSDDIAAVVQHDGDGAPARSPFWVTAPDDDSPAFGCCTCRRTYGNWMQEYS